MWLPLMLVERRPVAVHLVKDPGERLTLDEMRGVDQRPRLVLSDIPHGLRDELVESGGLRRILKLELHNECKHQPHCSKRMPPGRLIRAGT